MFTSLSTSELVNTNSMFYIYFHWVFYICFCHINKLICILQNISMCPCTFFLYQTPCDKSDNDNVGLHNMYQVHILIMTCIATSSIGRDSFYKKKYTFVIQKGMCWAIGLDPRTWSMMPYKLLMMTATNVIPLWTLDIKSTTNVIPIHNFFI